MPEQTTETLTVSCFACEATAETVEGIAGPRVPVGWGRTGTLKAPCFACPIHLPDLRRRLGLSEERPTDA